MGSLEREALWGTGFIRILCPSEGFSAGKVGFWCSPFSMLLSGCESLNILKVKRVYNQVRTLLTCPPQSSSFLLTLTNHAYFIFYCAVVLKGSAEKECGQQGKRENSVLLLCSCETSSLILHPVLVSPSQGGHRTVQRSDTEMIQGLQHFC